jgi:hypothetical protein
MRKYVVVNAQKDWRQRNECKCSLESSSILSPRTKTRLALRAASSLSPTFSISRAMYHTVKSQVPLTEAAGTSGAGIQQGTYLPIHATDRRRHLQRIRKSRAPPGPPRPPEFEDCNHTVIRVRGALITFQLHYPMLALKLIPSRGKFSLACRLADLQARKVAASLLFSQQICRRFPLHPRTPTKV